MEQKRYSVKQIIAVLKQAELEALRAIGVGFRQPIDHVLSLDTPAQALE